MTDDANPNAHNPETLSDLLHPAVEELRGRKCESMRDTLAMIHLPKDEMKQDLLDPLALVEEQRSRRRLTGTDEHQPMRELGLKIRDDLLKIRDESARANPTPDTERGDH